MSPGKIANAIGLALLLVGFTVAATRVLLRTPALTNPDLVVIRIAHWQLEPGLRGAIDHLARLYEEQNPGVKVEQIAVPQRLYEQWTRVRLIGETAPQLIQVSRKFDDETFARYFVPLDDAVEIPNPHNRDTPFADVPWRDTFLDGMSGHASYRPNLLAHYAAPVSAFTVRMFYNQSLWRRLFGDRPVPSTYEEFLAICAETTPRATRQALSVIPIAGARETAPMLIDQLVASQTQRLVQDLSRTRNLLLSAPEIAIAHLRGEWDLDTPAFLDALAIAREVGLSLQSGYTQLGREDAIFHFVQGRALMMVSGSWDSPGLRAQSAFPIGVFEVPFPSSTHPRYGPNLLGPPPESGGSTGLAFALTRQAPHAAQALDFLQFITSHGGNARFSQVSGWLPSVQAVDPPAEVKPFLPRTEGHVAGFGLSLGGVGATTAMVMDHFIHLLVQPTGSVDAFRQALLQPLPAALHQDLQRTLRLTEANISRQDTLIAGHLGLARSEPTRQEALNRLSEIQNQQESLRAWLALELARSSRP